MSAMKNRRAVYFAVLLVAIAGSAWVTFALKEAAIRRHDAGPGFRQHPAPDPHAEGAQVESAAMFAALGAAKTFNLANGLQVLVIPDSRSKLIAHAVWYRAGAADDPPGRSGLAHLTEHVTFGGTATLPEPKFMRLLERISEAQDAITTYDYTAYYQLVRPEHLEQVITLEADRMSNVSFSAQSITMEGQAVVEERRNEEADVRALLEQQARPILFPKHPYGKSVLGAPQDFRQITADDLRTFYRRWYAPNNALLVLYGPVDIALANSLVGKHYGKTPARLLAARQIPVGIAPSMDEPVIIKSQTTEGFVWRRDYLTPSYAAGATQHAYALQLLAEILGGGKEGRLFQALVSHNKLALEITVHYEADSIDHSLFSISATLRPGVNPDRVGETIDNELKALVDAVLPRASIAHAKQDLKARIVFQEEGMPAAARLAGEALVRGRTLENLVDWPNRIDAISESELRAAAQAVLVASNSVTSIARQSRNRVELKQ